MVGLKELDQLDYGAAYQRGSPSVTQQSGLAGLAAPSSLNIANANANAMSDLRNLGTMDMTPPPAQAAAPQAPVLAISRSSGKIWANGKLFTLDDAQGAIESEQFLAGAPQPAPAAEAGDWEPLDMDAYAQHLETIKNPSLSTLASKNFGIGVDNMQMLGGYGLQFLGAEQAGQAIVRQQLEDINKNAPYQRNFTDIGSDPNRGVLDWFVANLAQQGPNLVESVVTAAIGAGAGAVAGGGANPFTAAGGLISSMVGKQAFKQAVLSAAKKYAAGEALDAAETKLLREAAGLTVAARKELFDKVGTMSTNAAGVTTRFGADDAIRAANNIMGPGVSGITAGGRQQAIAGGAALASLGQNYATGVADLYGESVEGGTPDRGLAALGGVPYAAAETLPEFIAALRIFKGIGARTTALAGKSALGKAGEIGIRAGQGAAAGAVLEGSTELGQEALGLGMNAAVDIDSPEGISRLLNAFAAGAAIGGFIGGASNMNTGKPHDLLSAGTKPADLDGPTLTGEVIPPTQPRAPVGPDGSVPLLGGPAAAALPGPTPAITPDVSGVSMAQPQAGATPAPQALPSATTIYNPAPAPTPMLTGPEIPTPPAPSVTPDVIPMGGPTTGSALQQAAEGTLTGGIPTGPLANRLQQQAAQARTNAAQQAEQQRIAAQQEQVTAASGSALARLARGEMTPPINEPGGRVSMGGEATGQMVEPMTGKAKLKRGKKVMRVEGMPQEQAAPAPAPIKPEKKDGALRMGLSPEQARTNSSTVAKKAYDEVLAKGGSEKQAKAAYQKAYNAEMDYYESTLEDKFNAAQEGQVEQVGQRERANLDARGQAAEASGGNSLKRGGKKPKEKVAQAEQQPGPEVSANPVHDTFVAEFDDARLNDANKLKLRSIVKRAKTAGVLTDKDMKELDIAFKDRDMTADDIAPLASSLIEANKGKRTKAPEEGKQQVPAKVKDEVPDKVEPEKVRKRPTFNLKAEPKEEPSPKAEGVAAAPEPKAEPSTAVAVYNPAPIVDPEREAFEKAKRMAGLRDEAEYDTSYEEMIQDYIDIVDSAEPGTVEHNDALSWLIDAKMTETSRPLRRKLDSYLTSRFTDEELELHQRTMKEAPTQGSLDFDTIVTAMQQINSGAVERLPQSVIGKLVAAWKRLKPSNPDYGTGKLADYITGGPTFFNMKAGKVEPKGKGRYSVSMWDKPDSPMNVGKIKLVIGKFISRLAKKPTVHVFRNQADLKASDPKLYARMAAGRPGDFDTVNAAGYSLGDEIVVFSDRIGSEQHLAFVLAHETLGHFGMRGLMGNADFNKLMASLYDTDPRLKAAVDAAMTARGLSKAEAVEEYLSDYAAQLHTSLVRRVWKGIKGVLNRIGIQFGDEATRYLLSQANRYVKTGKKSAVFETSSVLYRIWGTESGQVGRFSTVEAASENERVADLIRRTMVTPTSLKEAGRILKNGEWTWDKFKEQVFSLSNFQALRNPGLYAFEKLMDETRQREQYIFNRYNTKLETMLYKSERHLERVSQMLMGGRAISVYRLLDKPLGTKDRDNRLFSINDDGELIRNETAIDEYIQRGILSKDDMRNGVKLQREIMGPDGKPIKDDYEFPGIPDLTDDEYNDYILARRTIADVEIELLSAKYLNFVASEKVSVGVIKRMLKKANVEDAQKIVKRTLNKYKEIYVAGYTVDDRGNVQPGVEEIQKADDFLEAVNRALIDADKAGVKNDEAVRKFFDDQKQADDFMATLADFRDKMKVPDGGIAFQLQNEMKRVVLDDVSLDVEEERAKRTMAGGYVPVIRDEPFEMRLQAFDTSGKPVKLHEDIKELLTYAQFDSLAKAERAKDLFTAELEGKTFEVYADKGNGFFETVTVSLKPTFGPALQHAATDPALNLDEFLHGLRLFKINLPPDKMTKVIRELTASGDQLRKRLRFSNTPGYDKNSGVFAMARHIQLRGATIAKTITRPRLRELLDRSNEDSANLWNGDVSGVFSIRTRMEKETNPVLKQHYKHQLDHKISMFVETYPNAKGWDGSRAGYDKLRAEGKLDQNNSNRFYDQAQSTMNFLEANKLVSESNFGAGKVASTLRAFTSVLQLGGSIAQGVMNMTSPYTNWLPYMASYNEKNGFGGGFGVGKTMAAYQIALNQVGLKGLVGGKYNTAEFYEQLARNKDELAKTGLTIDEAEALAAEIREGKLIPAQSNALLGTARTGTSNRWVLRGIDVFMAPFNVTEQASRRAAFLAAYRLAKARNMADDTTISGKERDNRLDEARAFAVQSLDLTLGEYSVLNRPPAWRDGIQSFLYMYKVYPTTTIQMFRRLDKKGQIIMLGTLWMFAGVTGFPFAEDIEDLIDTLSQMLGLQMGSVRAEFVKILEDVAPGVSPYVLKGAINTALGIPADVASRFSQGDFVPGTGLLLAGSTIGEEIKDILGPMPAMALGTAATARDLLAFPFSEGKTFVDVARSSPVTLGRMLGDTWAYASTGSIIDKRGYVVAPDATIGQMAARLLGFYPKAAAEQYDAIRVAKRVNNYQKEIVGGFRTAWIRERGANNFAGMREIEQAVEEWNRAAKGTGLEISNFRKNSERAFKEASLSAAERTLKATSKAGREDTARLMDYMIATE